MLNENELKPILKPIIGALKELNAKNEQKQIVVRSLSEFGKQTYYDAIREGYMDGLIEGMMKGRVMVLEEIDEINRENDEEG